MKTMHLPKSRIEQLLKDGRCCIDRDLKVGHHIGRNPFSNQVGSDCTTS